MTTTKRHFTKDNPAARFGVTQRLTGPLAPAGGGGMGLIPTFDFVLTVRSRPETAWRRR